MRKTENLELNLPEPDDFFDVSHQNENFETIDEELNNKAEKDGANATGTWGINITGNAKTATKATSADKLNTNAGSATQPTYFADGIPKACTHTLEKSVPADAVFTDTKYKVRTRMTELGFTCGETYTVQQFFDTLYDKGISENTLLYFIYDNSSAAKVSDGTTTIDMNGVSCYISVSNKYQVYVKHNAIVTNERKAYLLYKKHDGSATPSSQGIVDLTSTVATSCTGNSATATKATQDGNGNVITDTYVKKDVKTYDIADFFEKSADITGFELTGTLQILGEKIVKIDLHFINYSSTREEGQFTIGTLKKGLPLNEIERISAWTYGSKNAGIFLYNTGKMTLCLGEVMTMQVVISFTGTYII